MDWQKEARRWQRAYWKVVDDGLDDEFIEKRKELRKKAIEKSRELKKKEPAKHRKYIAKGHDGKPVTILESVNHYVNNDESELLLL